MIFVFIVLLISTFNIVQSILSVLCVGVIVLTELSIMVLNGWEFGISESTGIVVVIGLSVDYVVHLSAAYMHSPYSKRAERMKQAFTEMGPSIFSGTLTTFGSGFMLFGGQMIVFQKFAVLITSTVVISFCVSMVIFGAIMHIIGPEKKEKVLKENKVTPITETEMELNKQAEIKIKELYGNDAEVKPADYEGDNENPDTER